MLALADADGPSEEDRVLLMGLRASLREARDAGTTDAWTNWYKTALDASRTLTSRWTARKHGSAVSQQDSRAKASPTAVARLRDAPSTFTQRWATRLQDQAHQMRDFLLRSVEQVPVQETDTGAQIVFNLAQDAREEFGRLVAGSLNRWAGDVATNLTPSWHEWVLAILTEEQSAPACGPPPAWPSVHLTTSAQLVPHVEPGAARRVTLLAAFQRGMQVVRGLVMVFVTPLVGIVAGGAAKLLGLPDLIALAAGLGTFVLAIFVVAPAAVLYGRSLLRDEREQSRRDHLQRQRASLASWVSSTVDAHRIRMNTALSSSASDMKTRMVEWIDSNYESPKRQLVSGPDPERDQLSPLLSSLTMVRNTLAARLAQLDIAG